MITIFLFILAISGTLSATSEGDEQTSYEMTYFNHGGVQSLSFLATTECADESESSSLRIDLHRDTLTGRYSTFALRIFDHIVSSRTQEYPLNAMGALSLILEDIPEYCYTPTLIEGSTPKTSRKVILNYISKMRAKIRREME